MVHLQKNWGQGRRKDVATPPPYRISTPTNSAYYTPVRGNSTVRSIRVESDESLDTGSSSGSSTNSINHRRSHRNVSCQTVSPETLTSRTSEPAAPPLYDSIPRLPVTHIDGPPPPYSESTRTKSGVANTGTNTSNGTAGGARRMSGAAQEVDTLVVPFESVLSTPSSSSYASVSLPPSPQSWSALI